MRMSWLGISKSVIRPLLSQLPKRDQRSPGERRPATKIFYGKWESKRGDKITTPHPLEYAGPDTRAKLLPPRRRVLRVPLVCATVFLTLSIIALCMAFIAFGRIDIMPIRGSYPP